MKPSGRHCFPGLETWAKQAGFTSHRIPAQRKTQGGPVLSSDAGRERVEGEMTGEMTNDEIRMTKGRAWLDSLVIRASSFGLFSYSIW
jgi:hypothetical protein